MRNAALGLYHKATNTSIQMIQIHILLIPVLVNPSPNCDAYYADGFPLARNFDVSAGSRITARSTMNAPLYVVRPRVFELRRGSQVST
jgi:hypothetical protein